MEELQDRFNLETSNLTKTAKLWKRKAVGLEKDLTQTGERLGEAVSEAEMCRREAGRLRLEAEVAVTELREDLEAKACEERTRHEEERTRLVCSIEEGVESINCLEKRCRGLMMENERVESASLNWRKEHDVVLERLKIAHTNLGKLKVILEGERRGHEDETIRVGPICPSGGGTARCPSGGGTTRTSVECWVPHVSNVAPGNFLCPECVVLV